MISIIIPTINEASVLPNTLESLQSLRGLNVEVIVSDGGSTDGTIEIAKPLVDKVVRAELGRALQLNEGGKAAQGELLVFLHADTKLTKDTYCILEPYTNALHWGRFNVNLSGDRWVFRVIETMMNWRSCLTGIATGDQAIFVSADLFNKVKGFPAIALMEDIAISKRLKKYSWPLCLKQTVETSSRRWEEKGVLTTIWLMWRLRWSFFFNTSPDVLAQRYKN